MTEPTEIDGVPEELRAVARAVFSGQPPRPDGTLLLDSGRNPWRALDDALAAVLPTYREMVLREATKQDWEAKLSDLAEESIRANFTTMIEKLADERMASLADLIRADTRPKVSAEIIAERDSLPDVTIDDRIYRTAMVLAARIALNGPTNPEEVA